jgi:hypothetical protein
MNHLIWPVSLVGILMHGCGFRHLYVPFDCGPPRSQIGASRRSKATVIRKPLIHLPLALATGALAIVQR